MSSVKTYLLIDTHAPLSSVYLVQDAVVIDKETWTSDKTLGTVLLSVIDELLVKYSLTLRDIARIGVHKGPGHYSALRTGITAALFLTQEVSELVEITGEEVSSMLNQLQKNPSVATIVPVYE